MSIEELQKDSEEFTKLLGEAKRKRVKDALVAAKAEVDREIVTLEMKQKQSYERKENVAKRYYVDLTEYGWDQSDKYVKIFVTLEGVENLDESAVTTTYTDSSMILRVNNLNGKDYGLVVNNLLHKIDVAKSYRKVKSGMVAIYMKKCIDGQNWHCLTSIEKRLKDRHDAEMKNAADDPSGALVNIMKKLYNEGDTKTKQMVAKAWTESQEKISRGESYSPMVNDSG